VTCAQRAIKKLGCKRSNQVDDLFEDESAIESAIAIVLLMPFFLAFFSYYAGDTHAEIHNLAVKDYVFDR